MFWSLYQMAPNGLTLFAVHNVDLMIGRVEIQPQWIQNINTVCIVLGGRCSRRSLPGCARAGGASTYRSSSRRRCS